MTPRLNSKHLAVVAALALAGLPHPANAGSFYTDFNSDLPNGAAIFGTALISPNDGTGEGITNSGCLQLTQNSAYQAGSFIITNDLDAGVAVTGFTAQFKVFIGSRGSGADGLSFNFAPDIPLDAITQEGAGTGLTVKFDTYANAPDIGATVVVKIGGTQVASTMVPGLRRSRFVDGVVQLNPDNSLNVIYNGVYIYSNLNLAATSPSYTPAAGSIFALGASTGGLTDNHWVDNFGVVTTTNAAPFVRAFGPRGLNVPPSSAVDILLADLVTQVRTNSISLKLDGITVSPVITTDGAGGTLIHFVPGASFAYYSTHSVALSFTDNATPTPHARSLQYEFSIVPQFVALFSDSFETRNLGVLDQNYTGGPNEAVNGDPAGNPWFGPAPPNSHVTGTVSGVIPHSGTNMLVGNAPSDFDEEWYNVMYRLHGGVPYAGNVAFDWWFYDPLGPNGTTFRDYGALGYYGAAPATADYPGTGSLNGGSISQRLSLGATYFSANSSYDGTKYQARIVGATSDVGITGSSGWFNTATPRSIGWHHGRIVFGPFEGTRAAPDVDFYIDDMVNPSLTHNNLSSVGINVIELNVNYGATSGYFDDVSFSVAKPPPIAATQSGNNMVLTWIGDGFTLQSSPDLSPGSWTDITDAVAGYTYDATSVPQQFFRLRN
jgi:hypothetical protein